MTGQPKRSGGARPGSGPRRRRLHLSGETARTLALLTKERRALLQQPDLREEDVVARLVDDAWSAFDTLYQENAERADISLSK